VSVMTHSHAVTALLIRYAASIAFSLLGVAAATSPLAAGSGPLVGYEAPTIALACVFSLLLFMYLSRGERSRFAVFAQGLLAAVVLPGAVLVAPLLICIFITHGTCS
jgi:hypothetical protein